MEPKFKYGDRVWANKYPGKVVSVRKVGEKYICTVRFDDENLLPAEKDCEEEMLSLEFDKNIHCSICGSEYNVVRFNMKTWKDCKNCDDTKENLEKQYAEEEYKRVSAKKEEPEDDLLKQFEKFMEDCDEDCDEDGEDDFFTFNRGHR